MDLESIKNLYLPTKQDKMLTIKSDSSVNQEDSSENQADSSSTQEIPSTQA